MLTGMHHSRSTKRVTQRHPETAIAGRACEEKQGKHETKTNSLNMLAHDSRSEKSPASKTCFKTPSFSREEKSPFLEKRSPMPLTKTRGTRAPANVPEDLAK